MLDRDDDLRWVLVRAFCPLATPSSAPGDPDRAADLARRLGLVPRLVSRQPWSRLTEELGGDAARAMAIEQGLAEARDQQIQALVSRVLDLGIAPIVLLKQAALRAAGVIRRGERHASDLDLLVPAEHAELWAQRLEGAGFVRSPVPAYEHHLPALAHPAHGMVELHTALPGVRLGGRRFARYGDLLAGGLLEPAVDLAGAWLPARELLAAHTLAHGLAQHGDAPASYPALQMLADLSDLGAPALARGLAWTGRDVGARDARAALALVEALGTGAIPERGAERNLLEHLLRGALDPREQRARKLRFARPLSDRPWLTAHTARWRRVLFPSAAELRLLYGPPGRFAGAARQRVLRPVDIVWRTLRALASRGGRRRP